ncbi:hypothetical protein [Streptomyces sp. NPDC051001]|uniref:hypothetical protein n=1 Tax=Streptomyces sp. NPDC051001 TaxID=3155795 RepID=UPI003426A596
MGVLWFALGAAGDFVLALPVALWFDALRAISFNAPSGTHVCGVPSASTCGRPRRWRRCDHGRGVA